jgi:hypothetical protein
MITNLRDGVSVCRRYDIGNQQQDGGGTRDERASRGEPDYATERRKYKPREQCVVERVVLSLKETFIIVIEGLSCTMSWDGREKLHLQAPINILYRPSNWWKMINYMVCRNNGMSSPEVANYDCRECNSKFNSLEEMDEHMKKVHNLKISNE